MILPNYAKLFNARYQRRIAMFDLAIGYWTLAELLEVGQLVLILTSQIIRREFKMWRSVTCGSLTLRGLPHLALISLQLTHSWSRLWQEWQISVTRHGRAPQESNSGMSVWHAEICHLHCPRCAQKVVAGHSVAGIDFWGMPDGTWEGAFGEKKSCGKKNVGGRNSHLFADLVLLGSFGHIMDATMAGYIMLYPKMSCFLGR